MNKLYNLLIIFFPITILYSCSLHNEQEPTEVNTLYSIAFIYDSTEFSEENIESYKLVFNQKLDPKIEIFYHESSLSNIPNLINSIKFYNFDIIIIGSNSFAYNKKIIESSNKDALIFSPTEFETLSQNNTILFGISNFEIIKTLVNYYLYSQNHERFFLLFSEELETEELSKKTRAFLESKPKVRYKIFDYNLNTLNMYCKIISNTINNNNHKFSNKAVIIIIGAKRHFNEIFSISSMFGLDRKAILVGNQNADIIFDPNFPIIFSGLENILKTQDKNYYLFNDDGYNKFLFQDIALILNNILLNEFFDQENFLESFLSILHSQNFNLNLGKTSFKKSIVARKYSIIKKIEGEYQMIW